MHSRFVIDVVTTNHWSQAYANNKTVFVLVSIIIVAMIVDTSIIKISYFISRLPSPVWDNILFSMFVLLYAIGQYFILRYVKVISSKTEQYRHIHLNVIHKSVSIVQYILVALLLILIIEMLSTSSYHILLVAATIGLSYISAAVMIGILAYRFFSWFKSNHNLLVFSYGIAGTLLMINAIFTFGYVFNILVNQFPIIEPHIGHIVGSPGSSGILYSAYVTSSILSFISIWFATILLLYNYSRRLRRAKFWILVSIPLVYFLSQFQPLILEYCSSFRQADPVSFGIGYTLILNVNKPVGGILFGLAFLTVARSITHIPVKSL